MRERHFLPIELVMVFVANPYSHSPANFIMSFGFSVGDLIAAIELANKIRKEFVDAPSLFKAISDESRRFDFCYYISNRIRNLSVVLQDTDVAFSKQELM